MSSRSRWKLLTALVLGFAALGVIGWQRIPPGPVTPATIMLTPTVTRVSASQVTIVHMLSGKIFFDYNGNGKQDRGEPDLSDVVVALDGKNATSSNSTGWYAIDGVVEGNRTIRPYPPKNFRYMCESDSEFRTVKETYTVSVFNDTRKDIGLMEGFLTLPLTAKTKYSIERMYDWDSSTRTYLWWNGKNGSVEEIVDVNHSGIDYNIPVGEDVVAMAPGRVSAFEHGPQGQLGVTIAHMNGELSTYYTHLSRITVQIGQSVSRGEKIGESGMSGAAYPHLHINNYRIVGGFQQIYDFYAPTFLPAGSLNGYWERVVGTGGDFYWEVVKAGEENPSLLGFWTLRNNPQCCT